MRTTRALRSLLIAGLLCGGASIASADRIRDPGDGDHGGDTIESPDTESPAPSEAEAPEPADPTKDYNFVDLGYRHKKHGDEPMSPPFLFAIVNFGILLILLARYGSPAIRKMAETRSDQIKSALDEAAKLREAAQHKLDEYSTKLASAQREMDAMLASMRADAEAEKQRILASAEQQAAAMKHDAELRIAAEIQLARTELAREVALAATSAAEKLIREKSTAADQKALVDSFVANVETAAAGRPGAA